MRNRTNARAPDFTLLIRYAILAHLENATDKAIKRNARRSAKKGRKI